MSRAAARGKLDVVQQLVAAGANVQAKDRYGATPLHQAAYAGKPDIVRFLIEHGSPVDVADTNGKTPLMEAPFGGNVLAAEVLLAHGANPNIKDKDGKNALYWALQGSCSNRDSNPVLALLVKAGADLRFLDTLSAEQRERFQKYLKKSQAARTNP